MAVSGATRPDGQDPRDDPLIVETLRLWSYLGRPMVKDFGLGLVALELAGGLRGTKSDILTMWDLLCFYYEHLLQEAERNPKRSS
jgi:hypothetical protein